MRTQILALSLVLVAPVARAEEFEFRLPQDPDPIPSVFATLTVGALVPQAFNSLGFAATPTLTVGYFLPVLDHRLAASALFSYAQPATTITGRDARLANAEWESTLTARDFRTGLGLQYHFMPAFEPLSVYAGGRARLHFLSNRAVGSAGGAFGDQFEQGTKVGGAPFVGLLYKLGPGVLSAELEADLVGVDHLVTGDRNLSALALHVGYGFVAF